MTHHMRQTRHPAVTNCTRCDNLLVGRDDRMPAYIVPGPATEFLCEPCAERFARWHDAEFVQIHPTTTTTTPTPGDRVELDRMGDDDPHPLPPGSRGTVQFVDGLGTVHVLWDDGRRLGLVPGEDDFHTITEGDPR